MGRRSKPAVALRWGVFLQRTGGQADDRRRGQGEEPRLRAARGNGERGLGEGEHSAEFRAARGWGSGEDRGKLRGKELRKESRKGQYREDKR